MNKLGHLTVIILLLTFASAAGAENMAIRTGDWLMVKTSNECYTLTKSFRTLVDDTKYDHFTQLRVTSKGDDQLTFSVIFNKSLSESMQVHMMVGIDKYLLNYGRTNSAWSYSASQDASLVNELGTTSEEFIKITSYDASNNKAVDYFSIKGLVHSLQLMERNCLNE